MANLFIITGCFKDDDNSTDILENTIWTGTTKYEEVTLTFFKGNDFNLKTRGGEENINVSGTYVLSGKNISLKPNKVELETISGTLNSDNSKLTLIGANNDVAVLKRK